MIPGSGGTQRLVRLIGLGRAKDIVMRDGRRVLGDEALALGLVGAIMPADGLDAAVGGLVDGLSRRSPLALAMAKRVLNAAYDGPLHLGLELEASPTGCCGGHDFREGVEAFGEAPARVHRRVTRDGRVRPRAGGRGSLAPVEAAFRRPRPCPQGPAVT